MRTEVGLDTCELGMGRARRRRTRRESRARSRSSDRPISDDIPTRLQPLGLLSAPLILRSFILEQRSEAVNNILSEIAIKSPLDRFIRDYAAILSSNRQFRKMILPPAAVRRRSKPELHDIEGWDLVASGVRLHYDAESSSSAYRARE